MSGPTPMSPSTSPAGVVSSSRALDTGTTPVYSMSGPTGRPVTYGPVRPMGASGPGVDPLQGSGDPWGRGQQENPGLSFAPVSSETVFLEVQMEVEIHLELGRQGSLPHRALLWVQWPLECWLTCIVLQLKFCWYVTGPRAEQRVETSVVGLSSSPPSIWFSVSWAGSGFSVRFRTFQTTKFPRSCAIMCLIWPELRLACLTNPPNSVNP